MDKKGFLGMAFVDLWSFVLLVIILIAFIFMFTVSGFFSSTSSRVLEQQANMDSNALLLGLLRHNVGDGSMVEFILLNLGNKAAIETEVSKIMNEACNVEVSCYWEFELLSKGESFTFEGGDNPKFYKEKGSAEFLLPAKDEKTVVRLMTSHEMLRSGYTVDAPFGGKE